ncbi:M23 family metallopeptidase [Luteibaculum oceani]|uniref:M23 family metallopeptidase n=1 Tax=Luteibaculum oceani TaxID=1294296 RepID=A0A5C6V0F4_9FLAO|nr:M23 family metallopeptidase [Luteibaculum oceani]TXC78394.1 M23 family metallopeptidase [Luteibaculum oceani]
MSKHKYIYNPNTLNYEKINLTFKDHLKKIGSTLITGLVFASIIIFLAYTFFDSPKERALKRENKQLQLQYSLLNKEVDQITEVLKDVVKRDNNIYRVIFEADPIPQSVRHAGIGGVDRYSEIQGYEFSDLVVETRSRIDKIARELYIQSKSFDEVIDLAKRKKEMLASIPAIQPISNKDLTRIASGFGYRIHPIHKIRKMHTGMDFTAPTGTPIYATGDGKIEYVKASRRGYGNHVIIKHNFGYKTLYAHLSAFNVIAGQNVKRGDIIGYVGSTGTSTAPHLHYEVLKDNRKINPINFFFNDLTPEEYDKMIELSSSANQSFD